MRLMDIFATNEDYGYIYFVQMENTGPIKIGFTKNIKGRMESLQTASPYPLTLRHHFFATRKNENDLHKRFRKDILRGEWFISSKALKKEIAEDIEYDKSLIYRDPVTHDRLMMNKRQWLSLVRYRAKKRREQEEQ